MSKEQVHRRVDPEQGAFYSIADKEVGPFKDDDSPLTQLEISRQLGIDLADLKNVLDKSFNWYLTKISQGENSYDLALKLHDSEEPLYAWTFQSLSEFLDADPTTLAQLIPDQDIDKKPLAEELRNLQTATVKPWIIHLDHTRHETEAFPKSQTFLNEEDDFIPKRLADALLKFRKFVTFTDTKEIYLYNTLTGIWEANGETVIHEAVQASLKELAKKKHEQETAFFIQGETYTDRRTFETPARYINLRNGVYDLEADALLPHSPDFHFFSTLPLVYDPKAKCTEIERFLTQIQPDENDRQALVEWTGYCLYRCYIIHKAVMLVGDGSNGKSTYLNLLKTFLGSQNCSGVSLYALETSRFSKFQFYTRLANIYPDLPDQALQRTGEFKMLTGNDFLSAEQKFRGYVNFQNYAKLAYSCNRMPRSEDDSAAFYRRWLIEIFPNIFEGESRDPNILAKLTTESELSGLLNLALKALKELLKRGQFSNDRSTEDIRESYIRQSDSVKAYILDRIDLDPEAYELKERVFNDYLDYCKTDNYPAVSKGEFTKQFTGAVRVEDYRPQEAKERPRCWRGIRLRLRGRPESTLDKHLGETHP